MRTTEELEAALRETVEELERATETMNEAKRRHDLQVRDLKDALARLSADTVPHTQWLPGRVVSGRRLYALAPVGVFVGPADAEEGWLVKADATDWVAEDGGRWGSVELTAPRRIIPRPENAGAHVPHFRVTDTKSAKAYGEAFRMAQTLVAEALRVGGRGYLQEAMSVLSPFATEAAQRLTDYGAHMGVSVPNTEEP